MPGCLHVEFIAFRICIGPSSDVYGVGSLVYPHGNVLQNTFIVNLHELIHNITLDPNQYYRVYMYVKL